MKSLIISALTILLCGCQYIPDDWHKPTPQDVVNVLTNKPAPAAECSCPAAVIDPPAWLFLNGENECTLRSPDIRFLVGRKTQPGNWKFFGQFAVKHKLYEFDGKNVTGKCFSTNGICLHYIWQRPENEAHAADTNRTVRYSGCHRVYWEPRKQP